MPSYVITGVSKGIGWAFLQQISSDPNNTVVGIVRSKAPTDKRVAEELKGRANITILEADLTKYDTLKKAAEDTSNIIGGSLDYLIANAANVSQWDGFDDIGTLGTSKPEEFTEQFHSIINTNVLANIHLYNLFLPLVLQSSIKKVTVISSGMADTDFVNQYAIDIAPVYSISKTAMNMVTAKFNAQYGKKDGVLFLSVCPGMVDADHHNSIPEGKEGAVQDMIGKFQVYSPTFAGPDTPEDAVKAVLGVIEKSSVANGDGGAFLSHFGNKRWI